MSHRSIALVSTLALLAGCTVDPDPTDVPVENAKEELACTASTHAPTHHTGDVKAHEIWRADEGPHVIDADVNVRDGAILEIEPCAVVQVAKNAGLRVAFPVTPNKGSLIAEGTAKRPIRFEGTGWTSILVQAPGTARLAYVTLDGGGISISGDGAGEIDRGVKLDHVTVKKAGVTIARSAGLAAGSTDLVVEGAPEFPLTIGESAIGDVPTGRYTGNGKDMILIEPETNVQESATMHDRSVPYRIGTTPKIDKLVIGSGVGSGKPAAILTIEPGVTIQVLEGSGFEVEHATGSFDATGALIAVGTKEKPIVFTSASATPKAGDWKGMWYGGQPLAENRLENVRIEYTGADCGCILNTCSAIVDHEGAIIFTAQPKSDFVHGVTIAHASSHAIVQGYDGSPLDYTKDNEFIDVAGCTQTLPRFTTGSCPKPLPACS
ncbi:MAG: hypothetical protein ACXVEE_36345 [Polyangiales bacterium]